MTCSSFNHELILLGTQRKLTDDKEKGADVLQELLVYMRTSNYASVITYHNDLLPQITASLDDFEKELEMKIKAFVYDNKDGDSLYQQQRLLTLAIANLQLFVQNNWTGPLSDFNLVDILVDKEMPELKKTIEDSIVNRLCIDGETAYHLVKQPACLYIARLILLEFRECTRMCQTASWWLLRCLRLQQMILEARSHTLKATILELIDTVASNESIFTNDDQRDLRVQFHLEAAYLSYFYYDYAKGREHFLQAQTLSQLSATLTGVMGKRTRYQEENKVQLVLQTQRLYPSPQNYESTPKEILPKDIALNDDTLLENLKLKDELETEEFLNSVEQAVLLGLCENNRKNHAAVDELTSEETIAYLNSVLSQPSDWSVQSTALFLRCTEERNKRRRVERAMMQTEELVGQFARPSPSAEFRNKCFYSVQMSPKWEVEKELGMLFLSLGVTKGALEIFERLQLWEQVIQCYTALGRTEMAERLIQEQLSIKETPSLFCYLGDVTGNREHYEKAWELSNHKSPRAMRTLGFFYLRKEQLEKSMECFQKALEINQLQVGVWFSYGCAALATSKYDIAARCFRMCVTLDTDNFQAWNNLASAYARSHQKEKAFKIYKEALKCNYENWKIWENYMVIGADCGELEEVIRAYHRLLDLKNKTVDVEVIQILVKAVVDGTIDASEQSASRLRPKLLELFGRITSNVTNNATIWQLYAQLCIEQTQESKEKAVQYFQKAHRCFTQGNDWEKDINHCKEYIKLSLELSNCCIDCSKGSSNTTQAIQMLSSAKLMAKGVVARISKQYLNSATQEFHSEITDYMSELNLCLQTVVDLIEALKA